MPFDGSLVVISNCLALALDITLKQLFCKTTAATTQQQQQQQQVNPTYRESLGTLRRTTLHVFRFLTLVSICVFCLR